MKLFRLCWGAAVGAVVLAAAGTVQAQYEGGGGAAASGSAGPAEANVVDPSTSPLRDGSYAAILAQYKQSRSDPVLDGAVGGTVLLGYRANGYGIETGFGYVKDSGVDLQQFVLNGLLFPFESVPMLYGIAGVGAIRYAKYPIERARCRLPAATTSSPSRFRAAWVT